MSLKKCHRRKRSRREAVKRFTGKDGYATNRPKVEKAFRFIMNLRRDLGLGRDEVTSRKYGQVSQ